MPASPAEVGIVAIRDEQSAATDPAGDRIVALRLSRDRGDGGILMARFSAGDTAKSGILVPSSDPADSGQIPGIAAPRWWSFCWSRSC